MARWKPTPQKCGKYWRVRVGTKKDGKPDYQYCGTDKDKAEATAKQQLIKQKADNRLDLKHLTDEPAKDIQWAFATCVEYGVSLKHAVERFVELSFPRGGIKSTEELVQYFLDEREATVRQTTMRRYNDRFGQLAKYFGKKPVHEITRDDFLDFFDHVTKHCNEETQVRDYNLYRMFFRWCADNKYISKESLINELRIRKNKEPKPKLARPADAAHLLYWLCNRAEELRNKKGSAQTLSIYGNIVQLVLVMFAGLRRSEAAKRTWDDINFKNRRIRVDAETAKKKETRKNKDLPDNLWFWLSFLKSKNAFLPPSRLPAGKQRRPDMNRRLETRLEEYRDWHRQHKTPIPDCVDVYETLSRNNKRQVRAKQQNVFRHSFITYHLELSENMRTTARLAGNSVRMIEDTYEEELEDKLDAQAWFGIYPPDFDVELLNKEQKITKEYVIKLFSMKHSLQKAAEYSKDAFKQLRAIQNQISKAEAAGINYRDFTYEIDLAIDHVNLPKGPRRR